jgi:PleD family two-component response regulator
VPNNNPPLPGTPRRVLVADDNRDAADSLSMLLQLEGHDVRTAYDCTEECPAYRRSCRFDRHFLKPCDPTEVLAFLDF